MLCNPTGVCGPSMVRSWSRCFLNIPVLSNAGGLKVRKRNVTVLAILYRKSL